MNTQNNELHVIFGTGPVGLTLAGELTARGRRVRLVNRGGKADAPQGVEIVAADAMDPPAVTAAAKGASVLYHCIGVPYARQYDALPRFQKAMVAGAAANGAKLIVMDTLYMYGRTHGAPMSEQTPYAPTSRKGVLRAQIARDYLKAHTDGAAQIALGRAADFFGPRVYNSAFGERVFPPILAGRPAQVIGNIDLPHSYGYMPDIARGLADLGERPEALGCEWLLPVAPAATTRDMTRSIERAIGSPVRVQPVPKLLIQAMGIFDVQTREFAEMFYQYTESHIVDSSAFETTFGWRATPLDEAIAATVAWFRKQNEP